jgi:hypothetical protein
MSTSKIRIKFGTIEVEYEGSESFLKDELGGLLSTVSELFQNLHGTLPEPVVKPNSEASELPQGRGRLKLQMTTGTIAARLQAKSGADLALAAAVKITLVDGVQKFSRQSLIDEMKSASALYTPSYVNNLTRTLHTLVKDNKLNEPSKGHFALTNQSEQDLGDRLDRIG